VSLTNSTFVQAILSSAVAGAEEGRSEMVLSYHVDDEQSIFQNSHLVTKNGVTREKLLPVSKDLDMWFRRWRTRLSQGGRPHFLHAQLHSWN
jgi:hypothetical protein